MTTQRQIDRVDNTNGMITLLTNIIEGTNIIGFINHTYHYHSQLLLHITP